QAQLTLAEADLARAVELRAKDRVSAAEIDALTARRDLAKVAIDRAREAERRTAIRAPFDGWIGVREVDEGDVIDPSTVVGTLYEVDPLRAEVTVPERLASWAQAGAAAVVRVDAWPELTFPATLRYVAPAVDPATRTLTLRLALPNPDGRLRPGMSARAALQLGAPAPTLLLPAESVTTTADGPQVWVVQDGQAHARRVVTGERRDAEIVVLSGLEAGEAVVIEGIVRLREGAAVQVTGDAG
ncbi:MAG TPA: efflux RND transporter periplasmic adaptor subunit, partial [Myxococcota bacterium]|nr:efflux RND transporter periplasmic adaptor subunit [Myxococcota bacterium]